MIRAAGTGLGLDANELGYAALWPVSLHDAGHRAAALRTLGEPGDYRGDVSTANSFGARTDQRLHALKRFVIDDARVVVGYRLLWHASELAVPVILNVRCEDSGYSRVSQDLEHVRSMPVRRGCASLYKDPCRNIFGVEAFRDSCLPCPARNMENMRLMSFARSVITTSFASR